MDLSAVAPRLLARFWDADHLALEAVSAQLSFYILTLVRRVRMIGEAIATQPLYSTFVWFLRR